jgi:MFS family permease
MVSLNGIGAGPSEILQPAVIADIFFLHDRGTWNALYWVVYMGSLMIAPIIAGPMADRTGWQNFWWLNVGVTALSIVLGVFGFPETKWTRIDSIEAERGVNEIVDTTQEKPSHSHADAEKTVGTPEAQGEPAADAHLGKGTPSKLQWRLFQPNSAPLQNILLDIWTPWRLFVYPIVLFASFVVSWSCSNFLILNLTQSQVFAAPPYNMSSQSIGKSPEQPRK